MTHRNGDDQRNERFLDALVEELQAMSDTDALDGESAENLVNLGERLLDAARAEAGKLRMAEAKRKLSIASETVANIAPATAEQARRYLGSHPGLTLAARNLNELSDEDVLDLYAQAKSLEDSPEADAEDDEA